MGRQKKTASIEAVANGLGKVFLRTIAFVENGITAANVLAAYDSANVASAYFIQYEHLVCADPHESLNPLLSFEITILNLLPILQRARIHPEKRNQSFFSVVDDLEC